MSKTIPPYGYKKICKQRRLTYERKCQQLIQKMLFSKLDPNRNAGEETPEDIELLKKYRSKKHKKRRKK